ncbi:hypothetical protein ACFPN9_26115, partial [Bosea massiliensis]
MTSTSLLSAETETRRALQLDALSGILPLERRDQLAQILTDDDVATLRHLAREGMGENSLRALASDLAYLEAWSLAATGFALPWPAPEALVLKFGSDSVSLHVGAVLTLVSRRNQHDEAAISASQPG